MIVLNFYVLTASAFGSISYSCHTAEHRNAVHSSCRFNRRRV
jgi:hypothetical protein